MLCSVVDVTKTLNWADRRMIGNKTWERESIQRTWSGSNTSSMQGRKRAVGCAWRVVRGLGSHACIMHGAGFSYFIQHTVLFFSTCQSLKKLHTREASAPLGRVLISHYILYFYLWRYKINKGNIHLFGRLDALESLLKNRDLDIDLFLCFVCQCCLRGKRRWDDYFNWRNNFFSNQPPVHRLVFPSIPELKSPHRILRPSSGNGSETWEGVCIISFQTIRCIEFDKQIQHLRSTQSYQPWLVQVLLNSEETLHLCVHDSRLLGQARSHGGWLFFVYTRIVEVALLEKDIKDREDSWVQLQYDNSMREIEGMGI